MQTVIDNNEDYIIKLTKKKWFIGIEMMSQLLRTNGLPESLLFVERELGCERERERIMANDNNTTPGQLVA